MPTRPTHAASFQGMKITVNASASAMKPVSNSKFSVDVCSNSYVGYLRRAIAHHMNVSPANLRLFVGGGFGARGDGRGGGGVIFT